MSSAHLIFHTYFLYSETLTIILIIIKYSAYDGRKYIRLPSNHMPIASQVKSYTYLYWFCLSIKSFALQFLLQWSSMEVATSPRIVDKAAFRRSIVAYIDNPKSNKIGIATLRKNYRESLVRANKIQFRKRKYAYLVAGLSVGQLTSSAGTWVRVTGQRISETNSNRKSRVRKESGLIQKAIQSQFRCSKERMPLASQLSKFAQIL